MEKKNCLVMFPARAGERQALEAMEGLEVTYAQADWSREQLLEAMGRAQIILGEPKNEDLPFCTRLELLHSPCSGVNYYLEAGVLPENVLLCSVSGAYGGVIAQHMLGLLMAVCRRLPEYHSQQLEGRWQWRMYDKQLEYCHVLILGAGDIGTTLATYLRPLVKKITGMRRVERPYPDCFDAMITPDRLEEILPQADIVACALPQTAETRQLLNAHRLGLMKEDAILVNAGRGSLIDQEALLSLLEEGKFFGVGLDVTTPEPLPRDHPLWKAPRTLITPHASGNTFAPDSPLVDKIWDFMLENLGWYLAGEPLRSRIDRTTGYRALE